MVKRSGCLLPSAFFLLFRLALPCFGSPLPHFSGALPCLRCLPILLSDFLPLGSCFLEIFGRLLPFGSRVMPLRTVQTLCSLTIPRNIAWLHRPITGLRQPVARLLQNYCLPPTVYCLLEPHMLNRHVLLAIATIFTFVVHLRVKLNQ